MTQLPTLFVSHGAPTLAIQKTAASLFLRTLPKQIPKPSAVLAISAHWEERAPTLGTGTETIHDFYGFPQSLYRMNYSAAAAPEVAVEAQKLLTEAQVSVTIDPTRGRDHGVWIPMILAWPHGDIPIVQLSLVGGADPDVHYAIGQALKPLRAQGVLIMGSGSATHNLRAKPTPAPAEWAVGFVTWLDATLQARDDAALLAWRKNAPQAETNHPTSEHFDPIFVARGAASGEAVKQLHASWEFGSLSMNTYAFGD